MDSPSVLLVIERESPAQQCLGRALMMARYLHARLDILLCRDRMDPPWNPLASHTVKAEGREYMDAMRKSIVAPDVEIRTELASAGARHATVIEHARHNGCVLVIKRPWKPQPLQGERTDWELLHHCPVPLLLTHGSPWRPRPRFAAAIDPLDARGAARSSCTLAAAVALRAACKADLDILYVQPDTMPPQSPEGESSAQVELIRLGRAFDIESERLHVLDAKATARIPAFVAEKGYDLLAMGAPAEGRSLFFHSGTPLDHALTDIGCDLLVVHGAPAAAPSEPRRAPLRWGSMPLWQYIGAD